VSLRLRLGLWYGGLTGVVVLVMSVFTYAVHSRASYDDLDRALVGGAEHLVGEYAAMPRRSVLPRMLAVPLAPNVAVRVYGPTGRVVTEAPSTAAAPAVDPRAVLAHPSSPPFDPLVGLAPSIIAPRAGDGAVGLATDRDGVRWRVYVLPIAQTGRDLAIAASLERIDAAIAGFRDLVLLFALGGALVTLLAGWLLARRALHPVATLTETARAIARSHGFSRRVPVGDRRDELEQLAATFNEMLASLEQAYQACRVFRSTACGTPTPRC
jgi:HAMP domain-containing protein